MASGVIGAGYRGAAQYCQGASTVVNHSSTNRRWKRPPFITNPTLRWGLWVGAGIYLALAFGTMEVNWDRVAEGAVRGQRFVAAFFLRVVVCASEQWLDDRR